MSRPRKDYESVKEMRCPHCGDKQPASLHGWRRRRSPKGDYYRVRDPWCAKCRAEKTSENRAKASPCEDGRPSVHSPEPPLPCASM